MLRGIPKQYWFYGIASLAGLASYVKLCMAIAQGNLDATLWASLSLTALVFGILVLFCEKDPQTHRLRRLFGRGRSWSFMAGPFLIVPTLVIAARIWGERGDTIPSWAHQWWWTWLGFGAVIVFGFVFRTGDNKRYREHGCESMLKSPSKWWLDHWQMPVGFGVVFTMVMPTWFRLDTAALWTIALLACWVLLAVMDFYRDLDPRDQHVPWDVQNFRVAL